MELELVRVTTSDGVRLDGSLRQPAIVPGGSPAVDLAILVHGTASNFYSSTLMDAVETRLTARGIAVLRINTRGHDGISTAVTSEGSRRAGAAYEFIDDCRRDLAAWIRFGAKRDFSRLLLLGHSLGAVKSIYTLAHEHHDGIERLVAISPPRLSYSYFLQDEKGPAFEATYQEALKRIEQGRGDELMEIDFPLAYAITPRGYVDKYGPDERYNILNHLGRVAQRSLVLFGSVELQHNCAFRELPEEIERLAATRPVACEVGVIAGADHFYSGARDQLVARIDRWLHNEKPA
jgi:pimeloyl-ACP methyl ester carboxylesterase